MFTPKFGEKNAGTQSFQDCVNQGIDCVRIDVDRISSVVLRGVSHEGRLIGRGAHDQEQEGNRDTRVIQVQAISMT